MEPDQNTNSPNPPEPLATWQIAVQAVESKKAVDIRVLDLREVTTFADFFLICTGGNRRQVQAIADEVLFMLKKQGEYATNTEGYESAEWILIDYGDVLVHVFSEKARQFYELERLWRHAKEVELPTSAVR